ncbi:MAG: transposase [Myxococcales bacterium]|nr:transposase [Myxococcales bacterium]
MTSDELAEAAEVGRHGDSSIKAALDIDWSEEQARSDALTRLLTDVEALRSWIGAHLPQGEHDPPLQRALEMLARVVEQDLEPDPNQPGRSRIRKGVAKDRIISVEDAERRHGRKSKNRTINGFKKHIAVDVDHGLILAAAVLPANRPEHEAEKDLRPEVERVGDVVKLHADRGYLAGRWLRDLHQAGRPAISKPWGHHTSRFPKGAFRFDFEASVATCPAGETAPIRERSSGRAVGFPTVICQACLLRDECVPGSQRRGRYLNLHDAEELLQDLRDLSASPEVRAKQRERVVVEHRLARLRCPPTRRVAGQPSHARVRTSTSCATA